MVNNALPNCYKHSISVGLNDNVKAKINQRLLRSFSLAAAGLEIVG
jgi:hypothetical protein